MDGHKGQGRSWAVTGAHQLCERKRCHRLPSASVRRGGWRLTRTSRISRVLRSSVRKKSRAAMSTSSEDESPDKHKGESSGEELEDTTAKTFMKLKKSTRAIGNLVLSPESEIVSEVD